MKIRLPEHIDAIGQFQVSSGQFLEATLNGDFQVVTRQPGSDQQTWRIGGP